MTSSGRRRGGTSSDHSADIAVDPAGNIYVIGTTHSFGVDLSNVFLLRFDSSGNHIWQKTWSSGQKYIATGNAIAVDSLGSIYVTGYYSSPFRADPDNLYDILLLKFNSLGDLIWQRTWDGGSWDWSEGIAVDSTGGIYMTGLVSSHMYDLLLVKFDSSGDHAGIVTWGGMETSAKSYGIAVDSSRDAIVTGFVDGPPYTMSYVNGTISAPSTSLGVPSFVLDAPNFPLYTPSGVVETPSLNESNTEKAQGGSLLKFAPLSYTVNYIEKPLNIFGLPLMAFYILIGGAVVLITLTAILLLRRKRKK